MLATDDMLGEISVMGCRPTDKVPIGHRKIEWSMQGQVYDNDGS